MRTHDYLSGMTTSDRPDLRDGLEAGVGKNSVVRSTQRSHGASRPRVAFITKCLEVGGTEMHLQNLILRAPEEAFESLIVCIGPDAHSRFFRERGRTDVLIRESAASTFLEFRRLFAQLKADIIVFVNGKFDLFPWWAIAAARVSFPRQVIALEHLQSSPSMPLPKGLGPRSVARRLFGWQVRYRMARRAAGFLTHATICVSNAVRDTLVHEYKYPPGRTRTILNGIDLGYFRRSNRAREDARATLGLAPEHQVLTYVARLARLKRVDILLETVALLLPRYPALRCLVVGGGALDTALREQAESLQLSDVVMFVGHRDDVRPYLEATDIYVSSSEREGFGLSVVEAMAYELPCVITDIGGHNQLLSTPGTGLLVPPRSPEALASGIESLLQHPDRAHAIGRAARQEVERRFDINRMVTQLVEAFLF